MKAQPTTKELFAMLYERLPELFDRVAPAPEERSDVEPVAWVREHELPLAPGDGFSWVETFVHKTPLYTAPPAAQRQWVELTVEQKMQIHNECCDSISLVIELTTAKLKEKNT